MERFQLIPEGEGALGPVYETSRTLEVRLGRDAAAMREKLDRPASAVESLSVPDGQADVSRFHARIFYDDRPRSFFVEGLGQNGTFVNGVRIPNNSRTELRNGDRVQLGPDGPAYRFHWGRELAARAASASAPTVPTAASIAKDDGRVRCPDCGVPVLSAEREAHRRDCTGAGAAPAGPASGTAEMMRRFVGRLGGGGAGGPGAGTIEMARQMFSGMMEKRIGGRLRAVYVGLALLVAGSGFAIRAQHLRAAKLQDDIATFNGKSEEAAQGLREELARQMKMGDGLKMKLGSLRRKIDASAAQMDFEEIVKRTGPSVFQVIFFVRSNGFEDWCSVGTGFAVTNSVIVTNAHVMKGFEYAEPCVRGFLERAARENVGVDPSKVEVVGVARGAGMAKDCEFGPADRVVHKDYAPSHHGVDFPHDVAFAKTACGNLPPLELASDEELMNMGNGASLGLLGHPEVISKVSDKPGNVTAAKGVLVLQQESILYHDANTSGGASGSPLLNQKMKVVAINAGSTQASDEKGEGTGSIYGVGVSARVIRAFLKSENLLP